MAISNRHEKVEGDAKIASLLANHERVGDIPEGGVSANHERVPDEEAMAMFDQAVEQEEGYMDGLEDHIKKREGVVYASYKDSLGKLTAGVGHLLTEEEQALYPEGTEVPQEQVDAWLKADIAKAKKAAQKQAQKLPEASEPLEQALASVNFQLGTNWWKEHKNTWALLEEGKFEEAAEEAANSKWFEQTPVRVKDFQEALREQASKKL